VPRTVVVVVLLCLGSRAELLPTKEATSTCPRCNFKRPSNVVVAAVAVSSQSPVVCW